jgi:hypothetical protein
MIASLRLQIPLRRVVAAACATVVLTLAALATAAEDPPTAAQQKLPLYEFLIKSGISKRAKPESAILSGVITVERGGRQVVTSTTRVIYRRHLPEVLDAIQAAVINGTVVQAPTGAEEVESPKVGTLEMKYTDGKAFTVVIREAYYEITTSAGTIRFTSVPLTEILRKQLE